MINKGVACARQIVNSLGISKPNEYSLEEIIGSLKGPIINYKKLKNHEGRIVNGKQFSIITINEDSNIPRQRFTLAHEFGHYIMHKNKNLLYDIEENLWDWDGYKTIETEANYFAAELLMPEEIFMRFTKKEPFSLDYLSKTTDTFETSFLATAVRYAEVGNDPIALICSQNGIIKWFKVNQNFPFIDLREKKIYSGTLTDDYNKKNIGDREIDVDPVNWKINFNGYEGLKLIETILPFDQYGYILTFIYITK